MRILFLRIGIDRGTGGTLSPRFQDGTFEYVPIPESEPLLEGRGVNYTQLKGRFGGTLNQYSNSIGYAHYDPEFEFFTYGEPNVPKRHQLLKLTRGDKVVFYAGFQGDGIVKGTCYVIGYLTVKDIHSNFTEEEWPPTSLKRLHNNAHFRRQNPEPNLVVIEGDREQSRLFEKSLQLSDGEQKVLSTVGEIIGFNGSVKRAIGRWVPEENCDKTIEWLNSNNSKKSEI